MGKEVGIRPLVGTPGEERQKEVRPEKIDGGHCPELCPTAGTTRPWEGCVVSDMVTKYQGRLWIYVHSNISS